MEHLVCNRERNPARGASGSPMQRAGASQRLTDNVRLAGGSAAVTVLLLCGLVAVPRGAAAIEAPKSQPAPAAQAPPAPNTVEASDETRFYQRLQHVDHYRNLRELDVPASVVEALEQGDADVAVARLSTLAGQGSSNANVALVRVQHWCGRLPGQRSDTDTQTRVANMTAGMPAERAQRAAGVIAAEGAYLEHARAACARASFDYRNIEARLRQAADQGDPASATELAKFVRDPAQREALLSSAIEKNYAPAMYAVATNLLVAVQRGQTTENVGSIRELLKRAGRSVPKAKLDVANCMALGCDGHPADAATARAFGIDAARDGEPMAFLSMTRMPWGARMSRAELLAWQYFGDRLNEQGCMGDAYVQTSAAFTQAIKLLEKGQDPKAVESARSRAQALWKDYGERAMQENDCG